MRHIPQVLRGLAITPPLVMPCPRALPFREIMLRCQHLQHPGWEVRRINVPQRYCNASHETWCCKISSFNEPCHQHAIVAADRLMASGNGTKFVSDLPVREADWICEDCSMCLLRALQFRLQGDPWPDARNEEEWRAAQGVGRPSVEHQTHSSQYRVDPVKSEVKDS